MVEHLDADSSFSNLNAQVFASIIGSICSDYMIYSYKNSWQVFDSKYYLLFYFSEFNCVIDRIHFRMVVPRIARKDSELLACELAIRLFIVFIFGFCAMVSGAPFEQYSTHHRADKHVRAELD